MGGPVSESEKLLELNMIISWVQAKIDFEVSRRAATPSLPPRTTAAPNILPVQSRTGEVSAALQSASTPMGAPTISPGEISIMD